MQKCDGLLFPLFHITHLHLHFMIVQNRTILKMFVNTPFLSAILIPINDYQKLFKQNNVIVATT